MNKESGEIATILTIIAFLVIGTGTIVGAAMLSRNNKQTISSRASEACTPSGSWKSDCTGKCQGCAVGAAESMAYQCSSAGQWELKYGQCEAKCKGPCEIAIEPATKPPQDTKQMPATTQPNNAPSLPSSSASGACSTIGAYNRSCTGKCPAICGNTSGEAKIMQCSANHIWEEKPAECRTECASSCGGTNQVQPSAVPAEPGTNMGTGSSVQSTGGENISGCGAPFPCTPGSDTRTCDFVHCKPSQYISCQSSGHWGPAEGVCGTTAPSTDTSPAANQKITCTINSKVVDVNTTVNICRTTSCSDEIHQCEPDGLVDIYTCNTKGAIEKETYCSVQCKNPCIDSAEQDSNNLKVSIPSTGTYTTLPCTCAQVKSIYDMIQKKIRDYNQNATHTIAEIADFKKQQDSEYNNAIIFQCNLDMFGASVASTASCTK